MLFSGIVGGVYMRYLIVLMNGYKEEFWANNQRDMLEMIDYIVQRSASRLDLLYCLGTR